MSSSGAICGRPRPRKTFPQFYDQIACVHMSGLLMRSHMNAGQDGFRDKGSKTYERPHRRPVAPSECPTSWIDRSHHLLIILQVLASAQHGCSFGAPRVWLIFRQRLTEWRQPISGCILRPLSSSSMRCVRSCWPALRRLVWVTCA
jgi:hypothetical protein